MVTPVSRRSFLAMSAMLPLALRSDAKTDVPLGIELYSVRDALKKDPQATVRAVAEMGYKGVEFYAPYFDWTEAQTKEMRKLLDDLGIRCFSTHNSGSFYKPENFARLSDMNSILGSSYIVQSSAEAQTSLDGWKKVAENLNAATEKFETAQMKSGYHNHKPEFVALEGTRPIEVLAKNTKPTVMLQLDVGTCIDAGADPVEWIKANPGRIRSLHLKDWSPEADKGYKVLFGEGVADWKKIFAAAEAGGVEYYLMEQEGSRFSEFETARKCLETFRTKYSG